MIFKDYPYWAISLAIHIKWALYISLTWFAFGMLRFGLEVQNNYLYEVAAVVLTFWWCLERLGRNSYEWNYIKSPFRKPLELLDKLNNIAVKKH